MALQLLVNPVNFNNVKTLIDLCVHKIYVGIKNYSQNCGCLLTIEEIKELIKIKNKTRIYVNINKYFFEKEIKDLQKVLLAITKLDIDGIIFADFSIPQILFENKIKTYLVYDPDTLVTNYGQLDFYLHNGINEVCLARELKKQEIEEICKHKNKMKIQIHALGLPFMMHSRWPLLTNYAKVNGIKETMSNKLFYLKEEKRREKSIIFEDENGTVIFAKYDLNLINHLNEISKFGVDTIRIDSFSKDESWVIQNTKKYLDAINNKTKYSLPANDGFFSSKKENLIYLIGDNNE